MIIDALVTVLAGVLSFVGDLFGQIPVPTFINSITGGMSELAGYASGLGGLVPLSDAVAGAQFVFACMGIGFGIKLVRMVLSVFTGGGGGAG